MRVLVTGATGFVGSHAAIALAGAGHEVVALVRDAGKLERIFGARGAPPPRAIEGDVTDAAGTRRALDGCDAVVHTAAVVAMKSSRAREVLETNLRGVENVVGGAVEAGIRHVAYVSSIGALFDPGGPPITADSPVVEGENAYSKSKSQAERTVRRLQDQGAPIQTIYPTAVVGPDDPGLSEANHAIRTFARDVVVLTSGGFQLVDVRDVAAILARLVSSAEGPQRYLTGGHFFTWGELADLFDEVAERPVRRIRLPAPLLRLGGRIGDAVKKVRDFDFPLTKEGMQFATLWTGADSSRAVAELGIHYRPARDTVADTLRWLAEAGHL